MCFIPITPSQSSIAKRQVPERPDALCTVPPASEPHPWPCLKGRNTRDECTSTFCIYIHSDACTGHGVEYWLKTGRCSQTFSPKALRLLVQPPCLQNVSRVKQWSQFAGRKNWKLYFFYGQIIIQHKRCMVFAEQSLVFDWLLCVGLGVNSDAV